MAMSEVEAEPREPVDDVARLIEAALEPHVRGQLGSKASSLA